LNEKIATTRLFPLCFLVFSFLVTGASAAAQTLIGTVDTGGTPIAAAANRATNQIYVANYTGNNVTVIDGATNSTTTVTAGQSPYDVRVNPLTNKIYVSNFCGNDPSCVSNGTVTVIDGATNHTTTVNVGLAPYQAAVNTVTNKIYVANSGGNTVTVIDGATNQTSNVTVGNRPQGLAVNTVTNKIYVPNSADNTVTVIDGATLATTLVAAGGDPVEVAVNSVTNQIYVANNSGNTVTVIDGATNNTSTVNVDLNPAWLAVNQVTNQIYVANFGSNTVTVIDGATLNPTSVTVGNSPSMVVVDPVTNKIYVANYADGTMTMIDGATNNTTTLAVGNTPGAIEANVVTNKVYVPNQGDNTVSVIAGANAPPLQFVNVTPCRVYDSRPQHGGTGAIPGGTSESFNLPQLSQSRGCGDLSAAAAYSLNVTVIPHVTLGYLSIWPTGEDQPVVSTMNSVDGRVKADAAIVPGGYQGAISVYVTNTADVALDIDGYFAPVSNSTLAFYPLTPCRVADTRKSTFPQGLGTPQLFAGQPRNFPVLESSCIPAGANAAAYSFNFTVVPIHQHSVGYLSVWPTGQTQPVVSTLNDQTGTIVANAAMVPAGTNGGISAYATDDTNLLIDIDGYFAPAGPGALSLYSVAPCRVLDTRKAGGAFSGELTVDVLNSVCGPPSTAQAYVFNATVVPVGSLGYLALWPDGQQQPVVSTLNATDAAITSNMAIVPASAQGKIDAFAANGITNLLLDISSYFAP
jgi:YVTN family beta-propeller protein